MISSRHSLLFSALGPNRPRCLAWPIQRLGSACAHWQNLGVAAQPLLQPGPVEASAGVELTTGRHVLVTSDMLDREALQQGRTQAGKCLVLGCGKVLAFETLELNADRVVVAIGTAAVVRDAGVPGAVFTTDKLPKLAGAPNIEVTGDLNAFDGFVVGVLVPAKPVGKEALHRIAAVVTRGEAD